MLPRDEFPRTDWFDGLAWLRAFYGEIAGASDLSRLSHWECWDRLRAHVRQTARPDLIARFELLDFLETQRKSQILEWLDQYRRGPIEAGAESRTAPPTPIDVKDPGETSPFLLGTPPRAAGRHLRPVRLN